MWFNKIWKIRTGERSINANLRPLTAHIYHVMIILTDGFSKKSYYFFLEILLDNLELVILEFKHFYKTHRTSLFSFYLFIFYSFRNHSMYWRSLPFRTFPLRVNTLDESVLFFHVVSQSVCILTLSIFCTFCIQEAQIRKLKALIWPPTHFVVKFNKYPNIKNLFV